MTRGELVILPDGRVGYYQEPRAGGKATVLVQELIEVKERELKKPADKARYM